MSLLDNLPHTCSGFRTRSETDAMGGWKEGQSQRLFTNKACWRQPVSDREADRWMQSGALVTHSVYFAEDPVLDEGCWLQFGDDVLLVMSVADPDNSVGLGILWRVMCRKDRPVTEH